MNENDTKLTIFPLAKFPWILNIFFYYLNLNVF